jgi:hypothetical protein
LIKTLKDGVVDVKRQGDRIILVKLVLGDVLTRREDKQAYLDCKVIPGESVVPQHNLVVIDFHFRISTHWVKQAKIARTEWWKLKGETSEVFRGRVFVEDT